VFKFLDIFRKPKKIAFIDGDQPITRSLHAYNKYVANTGTETHFVRVKDANHNEPKEIRKVQGINKIYLAGMTAKKEATDKFIGAYIQRAVSEGYKEITVISSDYDFIDIFKMAVQVDPNASKVSFRMIIPNAVGRATELPTKMMNIEIIK
jgi:hypothetical protein